MHRLLLAIAVLAACKSKPADTSSGSSTTPGSGSANPGSASGPSGSDTPVQNPGSGSAAGSDSTGPAASRTSTAAIAGTSCAGHGTQITKAGDTTFKLDGTSIVGVHMHGCGCPKGPVYTVVYKAASPLEVRVCFDQSQDNCEMACRDVKVDIAAALTESKATAVKFVD